MKTVLAYLKSNEWAWNKGTQCPDCHGKNPSKWRPGPRLGHQPGCKLGPAIKVVEDHLAVPEVPTIPFPNTPEEPAPTPLQDYGERLLGNDNDF